jgi:hypothetical protein
MPDSGSGLFTDIEEYRAALPIPSELLVLKPSSFRVFLTVGKLPHMGLLRVCEAAARVAYVRLRSTELVVSFPTSRNSAPIYNGVELRRGELVVHQPGECFHHRTTGDSCWGAIFTSAAYLSTASLTVLGRALPPPRATGIVTPRPLYYTALLRLHARAGRIAETNLSRIAHPEVARALDQDLLVALLACLSAGRSRRLPATSRRDAALMTRLERSLAGQPDRLLTPAELVAAAQVSGRSLRVCADRVLGMDAYVYQQRKWLRRIDLALLRAAASGAGLEEVVRRHGLSGLQQFGDRYRSIYGEAPAIFLSRAA